MASVELADRERPLREDIRLVGRVLGDAIRQQQGEAAFATVERIRQISIAFRRQGDAADRRELEATLDSLSHDRTIEVGARVQLLFPISPYRRGPAQHPPDARGGGEWVSSPRGTLQDALARLRAAGVRGRSCRRYSIAIVVSPC